MNFASNITSQSPSLKDSVELMCEFHKSHSDGDYPYFYHPLRVMDNVLRLWPQADEETLIAALFHDVIEKCKKDGITADYLLQLGYSQSTVQIIQNITKNETVDRPYKERIALIIGMGDWRSILVKLADNMDNRHAGRNRLLAARDPEKAAKFAIRYDASIERLSKALESFVPHLGISHEKVLELLKSPQTLPDLIDDKAEINLSIFPQIPTNSPAFN